MTRKKIIIIVATAAVFLCSGWQYNRHAQHELAAFRLRSANDRLRLEIMQKRQRQAQPASVGDETTPPPAGSGASSSVKVADAAGRPPAEEEEGDYRRAGQATPVKAMMTLGWASDQGDAALMESLILIDPAARPKAEAYY